MMNNENLFYDNLKNQIIARACKDYAGAYLGRRLTSEEGYSKHYAKEFKKYLKREEEKRGHAIVHGTPEQIKLECEWFFHSDWFKELSGGAVDPDRLMKETIINTIDDVLDTLNSAFNIKNRSYLTLKIETPKERENISYPLPPLLADVCFNALRRKAKDLRKEAAELSEGHTPMTKRKAL